MQAGCLWCGTHMGWRGAICAPGYCIVCVCVWVCVCAGGAECPLLSKQQKCHPLPGDWCGRWRFYLIQGPDSKTGAMLLSLLFLSLLWRRAASRCWRRRAVHSNGVSSCWAKQTTKLGGEDEGWKQQRRVMPQINRCIMQELPERQFGITTQEWKTEAIKWMMSYSAESLNPSLWYRRIVFRRVYLGQAVQQQNAIRSVSISL